MSNVHKVTISHGEIVEDVTMPKSDFCYEMITRVWATRNNTIIREWTPNEYATLNPNDIYIVSMELGNGHMIDVVAHCIEHGKLSAYKDGHVVLSYHEWTDYIERLVR